MLGVDALGAICYANAAALERFARTRQQIETLTIQQLLPGFSLSVASSEPQPLLAQPASGASFAVMAHSSPVASDTELSHLITLLAPPSDETLHQQLADLTQRYRAAMLEISHQLRVTTQLYENAIEGMVVMDANGVALSVNHAYTNITGYSMQEVIGKPTPLLRGDTLEEDGGQAKIFEAVKQSGQWRREILNRRKNGESYTEMLTVSAIPDTQNNTRNFVAVFYDLSQVKQCADDLSEKGHHDALTGLPLRNLFLDRLQQVRDHALRSGERFAVMIIGLDGFRLINDSLGNDFGDQTLIAMTKRLTAQLRGSDTIARIGGDEFGIIQREADSADSVAVVVSKLLDAIKNPLHIHEQTLTISASIGVSLSPDDGDTPQELMRNANVALSRMKTQGGDGFRFYTAAMGEKASQRLSLESQLRKAVDNGEFILFHQPKVSIPERRIVGMESLIRWRLPDGSMVSPGAFIPLAEETGLIAPMGEWVLQTACRDAQALNEAGFGPLHVAVNLSGRQFQHGDIAKFVDATLSQTRLSPKRLELEITESIVMRDVEKAIGVMNQFKEMGAGIAVDDFGTGYSSLSYLKRFPLSTLKIDRAFVMGVGQGEGDEAIILAILGLARSLGLKVVAEGVEDWTQASFLQQQHCDMIQGFLFSKPLPFDELKALLEQDRQSGGLPGPEKES
ncbi:putative PAS/PAC sensor-containing diguanylate cyclase/phosphodiesterase [Magnetofaba australis IT-1]|uniref:Putative PAS/PAC sensor-containing diguanylate cyclase/phosphodiesterase n=1 Tax=Magnetofaba australis IT-1 TaxID=1434232 RepID=A0A1Y2K5W6_9PROT|nr:putative PAS/PAC sensor-containing diguanylate cyclase/phosphodiesterase [Magnetofaba australis IT-1]